MAKKFLEESPYLKEVMKTHGFKKTKREFVRFSGDAIQRIMIGHASQGERGVRYYSCSYLIEYKSIIQAANEMEVLIYGIGGLIDYLMPQHTGLIEWRLADNDTDGHFLQVIDEINKVIKLYLLPFMDKYSTIEDFLQGVENDNFNQISFDKKTPPIAYYLIGEKNKAISYINDTINRFVKLSEPTSIHKQTITEEYVKHEFTFNKNADCINYQKFAKKFKEWIDRNENNL